MALSENDETTNGTEAQGATVKNPNCLEMKTNETRGRYTLHGELYNNGRSLSADQKIGWIYLIDINVNFVVTQDLLGKNPSLTVAGVDAEFRKS